VEHIEDALHRVDQDQPQQKHLLIVASGINVIDISGAELLVREARRRRAIGGDLWFYFMKDAVHEALQRGGYMRDIGADHVLTPKADVVGTIYGRLDAGICRTCTARIFPQCHVALPNGEPRADESAGRGTTSSPSSAG
jgi:SulP family sulfate permease